MMQENQDRRSIQTDGIGSRQNENQFDPSKINQSSKDESRKDDDFPGYPYYPPSEDIMNPANQVERVPVDVENLAPTGVVRNPPPKSTESTTVVQTNVEQTDDELRIVPGTDADVTREDLRLLNATEGSYANASTATTVTGEDLDVPGADEDDVNEDIGEEDEENNYYSLGGDNHENLEELNG
jgi:hypothetical protein